MQQTINGWSTASECLTKSGGLAVRLAIKAHLIEFRGQQRFVIS
jgi:hypothetical protein